MLKNFWIRLFIFFIRDSVWLLKREYSTWKYFPRQSHDNYSVDGFNILDIVYLWVEKRNEIRHVLERAKGFEPSTSTLARCECTDELCLFLMKLYTFYMKIKWWSGTHVGHEKTIPYLLHNAKKNSLDSSS